MTCDFAARSAPEFSRFANRAQISRNVTPHTFSVTAPTEGDFIAGALQRLLGRDHLATTEIYLNLSPQYVIQEFNAKW